MNNQNENKKQLMKDIWNNIPQDNRNLKRLCIADVEQLAQIVDEQGYRKHTDVIKEFVEKISKFSLEMRFWASKVYQESNLVTATQALGEINAIEYMMKEIKKRAAEYGVEVDD